MVIIVRAPIDAPEAEVNELIYSARVRIAGKLLADSELDAQTSIAISIRVRHIRDRSKTPTKQRYAVVGRIDVIYNT